MRSLRATAASLALCASLSGLAGTAHADPGDGIGPVPPPPPGPTCYGGDYSYHVWNLFHPMDTYGMNSCAISLMLAYRRIGGTLAQFTAAMATARIPRVGVPASVLIFLWNYQTDELAICAAPGRGVELTISGLTGQVIYCRAQ